MAKALYNPKVFYVGKEPRVNTADIKRFVWSHAYWDLKVNEMKKFPDEVADGLLKNCEFLVEVTPKNIAKIKADMLEKRFKCPECSFSTDTKMALGGHLKSHGISEETKSMLGEIPDAAPSREYRGVNPKRPMTIEEREGIPTAGKDRDGVDWYGEGVEVDKK